MAKLKGSSLDTKLTVTLELNEDEARALDAIFGYNVDHFLKVFYEKMGRHYVEPHEAGVRSLHETIRGLMTGPLISVTKAREAMREALRKAGKGGGGT